MKAGEVSDVIQVEQIYTIVRLGEHTPAGIAKFEDVKAQLEKELPQSKKNQIRADAGQAVAAKRKGRSHVRGRRLSRLDSRPVAKNS